MLLAYFAVGSQRSNKDANRPTSGPRRTRGDRCHWMPTRFRDEATIELTNLEDFVGVRLENMQTVLKVAKIPQSHRLWGIR